MRIITERKLRNFWNAAAGNERLRRERVLKDWISVVRAANWNNFANIRETFNHADVYGTCTIFDVGGNTYRIIVKVAFRIKVVFIRAVLTHADYDRNKWRLDCK